MNQRTWIHISEMHDPLLNRISLLSIHINIGAYYSIVYQSLTYLLNKLRKLKCFNIAYKTFF